MEERWSYLFVVTACTNNNFSAAPSFVFEDEGAPRLLSPLQFEVFEDDHPDEDKTTTVPPAVDENFTIDWD